MTRFSNLPTLDDMRRTGRAVPKYTHPAKVSKPGVRTKFEIAEAKVQKRGGDRDKLHKWAVAVKDRDNWTDRYDGRLVLRTNEPVPRRAEAHHLEPKANKATRYDVRNGICLSYENHDKVERNELKIIGTVWFEIDGQAYIDATKGIVFDPPFEKRSRKKTKQ